MSLPIMSRRGFFRAFGKTAFVSASAGPFIQSATAAIQGGLRPPIPTMLAPLETYIAGTCYYQADEVRHLLSPSDHLILRRQPTNPYDSNAIEIFTTDNIKLGYVPAAVNQPYAELMDQGEQVKAKIVDVELGPFEDIGIQLGLALLIA